MPKIKKDHCNGCQYCTGGGCGILGRLDKTAEDICRQAGYKVTRERGCHSTGNHDHRAMLRAYGLEGWE